MLFSAARPFRALRSSCSPDCASASSRVSAIGRIAAPRAIAAVALVGACLAGCATLPSYPNQPLAADTANPDFQPLPPNEQPDEPVIIMAFSGGGSRATALSISVLRQLRAVTYTLHGKSWRLIDRVQVVSSVSGGSVAAAYFGLYGPDKMDGIGPDFLDRDNMATLGWTAANPLTWLRLTLGSYTRVDVMRDLFDRLMFHGKTFAELDSQGHPIILLNATDMVSGEVFAFTSQRFNDICSDLAKLPVSVGVASSAAFPILVSPMDLKNHSGANCQGTIPADSWIDVDLNGRLSRYINLEEFKRARYAHSLRRRPETFRTIDYLHLLDGGLADNQGIHSLSDTLFSPHGPVRLLDAINRGQRKRIVVINVNARSDPGSSLDQDPHTPGVISMIGSVASVPLDSATASLNTEMQNLIATFLANGKSAPPNAQFGGLRAYGITIDFDQFLSTQRDLQDRVKSIGTTWTVTTEQLSWIDEAATTLLKQHPCFQQLLIDLKVPNDFNQDFAKDGCQVE
jgi:NTE family protein